MLVHAVLWLQYRADPFYATYVSDALSYHRWAGRIAEQGLAGEPVFHQAPLFPMLVSVAYRVFGPTAAAGPVVALQSLLSSLAIVSLVPLGRLFLGSPRAGLVASMLALGYAPLAFHALKLLPVSLAVATQAVAMVWVGIARERRGRAVPALLAGAALGLAALARSEALLLLPVALVALAWPQGEGLSSRDRARSTISAAIAAVVVLAPVTIHNLRQGDPVLVASSAGENLYIGNQRAADGGHVPLHPQASDLFSQRLLARRVAEEESGRPLRPSEVSRYWRGRAWREIRADPGAWLALETRKLLRIVAAGDPADMYSLPLERRRYLTALYALPLSTVGLFALALPGLVAAWRRERSRVWPLMAVVGVQLGVLLAFFVSTRLRLPLLFFLMPFAGLGGVELVRMWRAGGLRKALSCLVLVVAVAGSLHWMLLLQPSAREAVRLASVLSLQGRLDESLAVLRPWIESAPPDPLALDQAGWVHSKLGDVDRAIELYHRALEAGLAPGPPEARTRSRLAALYERKGLIDRARQQHDAAVAADPAGAGAHFERGMFKLRRDDAAGAARDLQRAARLAPEWAEPRAALAAMGLPSPATEDEHLTP
jgi:4-amino-4-deoxy-L-arabinose transferase-like glycosyltransferase